MDFTSLNVSYQYRSDGETGNIIKDFYLPVLSHTVLYKRAVGYFSSGSLMLAAKGIAELIANGGRMQLIASPQFNESDIEAINRGYKAREDIIEKSLLRSLESEKESDLYKERLNYLAWLIANNRLDIKIAIKSERTAHGIYHEKLGVMEDGNGNVIAFSGSSNETEGGLYNNFESIDVFCSWQPNEKVRVEKKNSDFNNLWENKTKSLEIIEFPKAVKDKILSYKSQVYKKLDPELQQSEKKEIPLASNNYFPLIPSEYWIRDYQQEAIRSWFRNDCQGLLEMATGTGKTITALSAITKLWEVIGQRLVVVIVCPYTHLVDQWVDDIKKFNMSPIIAYSSRNLWETELSNYVTAYQSKVINHFCLITTNATYATNHMQAILKKLNGNVVFIADEAHHLGSENNSSKFINSFPFRLALSATPNRWYDEEGTNSLMKYFGNKTVFQFGLDKAIGKFLTEYYYYPQTIYLDEDESEKYYEITRKLVKVFPKDGNIKGQEEQSVQGLLIERARILSRARNKLIKLKELMKDKSDSKFNIVYCGDSITDGEKQIDAVINVLGNELDMRVHTFTSREDKVLRRDLLRKFEVGELQALVAIKCLDEGVDVPATQRAFILSSSTNPREFIQRRGRVLRKHPNKKYSYIYDFIVIPRNLEEIRLLEPNLFNMERKILQRELNRFSEFASLAINGPLAHQALDEFKKAYHLLDT